MSCPGEKKKPRQQRGRRAGLKEICDDFQYPKPRRAATQPVPCPEGDPATVQRRVIERLTRELGISAPLAEAVAGLAGLGPQELRHG